MKDWEILKLLIEANGGYLKVNKYTIMHEDMNSFTLSSDTACFSETGKYILEYLKL